MTKFTLALAAFAACAGTLNADTRPMPAGSETTAGSGGYTTVFRSLARSYQIVMNESVVQAAGIPVGSNITGIAFRNPSWQVFASWPGTALEANFSNFDVTMSRSMNPAGLLSSTYTENIAGDAVMVRSGPMVLPSGFNPGGALTPNVNPWGGTIAFTTPYTYTGGDLLLTIRHAGHTGGAGSGNAEATASSQIAGTQAIGVSSYTQPDLWYAQGMLNMLITIEAGGPVCGTADFDGDGDVGTDADIEAFFSCLGGNCCATCFPGGADFNDDGDVGTDADIEAFFRVLGGGSC